VASNTELEPILDWIVQKTTGMLEADEGSIKLLAPESSDLQAKTIVRKPAPGIESGSWPLPISTSVMGYLLYKGEPLATPDIRSDARFPGLKNVEARIRSVLAVPLRVGNRVTGMLAVTTLAPGREWTAEHIQLLTIVGANSAGVLEQARLRAEAEGKKRLQDEARRMERELDLARDIQMGLVPARPLIAGPWEVHGLVVPARQVGGDYFDFYELDGDRFGIAIGDVSGKGVPAALLMSNVQASLRAFCDGRRSLPSAMAEINRSVARTGVGGRFVTLFYAEIDHAKGELRYTNAGHNYPLLRRKSGEVEYLDRGGLILGIFDGAEYEEGRIPLEPGDRLLLYSDGVSEAEDKTGSQFGDDRLFELWRSCGERPTREIVPCLFKAVEAFRADAPQSDDMTALVVGDRT
jgi:sigma-B regulation protein RsbU (phosphoserine phosphatase)